MDNQKDTYSLGAPFGAIDFELQTLGRLVGRADSLCIAWQEGSLDGHEPREYGTSTYVQYRGG